MNLPEFYKGKKVFITGHTGFKGAWLCEILRLMGAEVYGYSLGVPTDPGLFEILGLKERIAKDIRGDVRDYEALKKAFEDISPEIVLHLAAQPIVLESYRDPAGTYGTNVMGTVHVCECIRHTPSVRSFVNVTTDKVYRNLEWEYGYRENDALDGYDPYSNSKSCSELVTASYKRCFFNEANVSVSTCRAGNVIGGGDFAADRIIPDCVRAMEAGKKIFIRNPYSVRPYQHVLEPLCFYLTVAAEQYADPSKAGNYNVGPDDRDCAATGELADLFCGAWGDGAAWETHARKGMPHEAGYLRLDCSRAKKVFGWRPSLSIADAIELTVEWSKEYLAARGTGETDDRFSGVRALTDAQIDYYFGLTEERQERLERDLGARQRQMREEIQHRARMDRLAMLEASLKK